ncbi:Barwin-like endoglucanase, partial [Corchorus capsularis]
ISRCGKLISIRASNGRDVLAKVVGECNSRRGCDITNGFQPPCGNNVIAASPAVFRLLRLQGGGNTTVTVSWK